MRSEAKAAVGSEPAIIFPTAEAGIETACTEAVTRV